MYFLYGAANHLVARNWFAGSENVLRQVVGVDVGRDKINRDIVVGAMTDESIRPCSLSSRRTTDTQARIN